MDLRQLKDRAHELDRAGKHTRAAQVYETLVQLQPKDPAIRLRLADALRKAGQVEAAVRAYLNAARLMLASGQVARARAVAKAAHQLAPANAEVAQALEGLARRLRPASSIREALESAAELEVEVGDAVPLVDDLLDDPPDDPTGACRRLGPQVDPYEVVWSGPRIVCLQLASGAWVTVASESPLKLEETEAPAPSTGPRDVPRSHVDA